MAAAAASQFLSSVVMSNCAVPLSAWPSRDHQETIKTARSHPAIGAQTVRCGGVTAHCPVVSFCRL